MACAPGIGQLGVGTRERSNGVDVGDFTLTPTLSHEGRGSFGMAGASGIGQLNRPAILFGIAGLFGWVNFSECWSVVAQADGVHEGVFYLNGGYAGPELG